MSVLPRGWVKTTIGTLCTLNNGRAFRPSDWSESGLPIIRIQNLNNRDAPFNHYDGQVEEKVLVANGDLLFAWSGTPGTSFGAHVWSGGDAVLNQHIFKVVFDPEHIDRDFFCYAINQKLQELIGKAHGGMGLRHITKGTFENTEILLPPRSQQRRIAAKIEELHVRTRRAREELLRVSLLLEPYRNAILDATFTDKEIFRARASRRLIDLVDPDRGIPYGIVQTAQPAKGGVPTVRAGDIKGHKIDKSKLKLVQKKISDKYSRTILRGGEVLVSIRGTVGNAAIATKELAGCNISREVALIPLTADMDPWYVTYFLSSPTAQNYILGHVKGVAQSGINLHDLRELHVPIIDLKAQKGIVHVIDDAFGWLASVEKDSENALNSLDQLDSAILSKAFQGRLVTPLVDEEPADALLERIVMARASERKEPKSRARRSSSAHVPGTRRGETAMAKKRTDVGSNYLSEVLGKLGGVSESKSLWQRSDMEIDEFYKQLRAELGSGLIRENKKKNTLERTNAA